MKTSSAIFPRYAFEITRGRFRACRSARSVAANNIAAEMGLTAAISGTWANATVTPAAKAAKMDFIASHGVPLAEELFEAGAERFADTPQEALNIMLTD